MTAPGVAVRPSVATLAMLSSDIEGSTRLLQRLGASYVDLLMEHRALLRAAFGEHGGEEQSTEGDAFFVTFPTVGGAIAAAVDAQRALAAHRWPDDVEVRVRIGIHVGDIQSVAGTAVGIAVHEAARIGAAGHGGQILVSGRAAEMAGPLPTNTSWRDLGTHRLKDIGAPMALMQLDHSDLSGDFPPPRSQSATRNNLPAQSSAFLGRETEISEVSALLDTTRMLTLTGAGGAGKSRLALRVAAEQTSAFTDGVWFVDLAPISDPAGIPASVVASLGLPESEAADVVAAIGTRRLLLVIDNCEHLVAGVADLVKDILSGCPDVQVMATSREPIGITGEVAWRVPSLIEGEALELFCARAQAVNQRFELTDENHAAVAEVCARLDAIPLALELAAARLGSLSVNQLADRLDQRFRLLAGGGRGAIARQRTLQAAVDWSYELLDPAAQAALRCLGVFVGGFPLEAAEVVCPAVIASIDAMDTDDLVDQLVAKSLVVAEEREGEVRFRLLETIRQYALDRLIQAGEVAAARDAHAAWVIALVARDHHAIWEDGEREGEVLTRFDLEDANIRAAFDWLRDTGRTDDAAALNLETFAWLMARGRPQESLHRSEALLADDLSSEARAMAAFVEFIAISNVSDFQDLAQVARIESDVQGLRGSPYEQFLAGLDGYLAGTKFRFGQLTAAEAVDLVQAKLASSASVSPMVRAMEFTALALAREAGGDLAGALEAAHRATSVAAEARLSMGESRSAWFAARMAQEIGDLDEADRLCEQSLAAARRTGDAVMIIAATQGLASARAFRDDLAGARDLVLSVLDLAIEKTVDAQLETVHAHIALYAFWAGDLALADEHIRRALDLRRDGSPRAQLLINAAVVAHELGETDRALVLLDEAAADVRRSGVATAALSGLLMAHAAIALDAGEPTDAVRLFGAAQAHRSRVGDDPVPARARRNDALVKRARAAAGTTADAAWAEGEGLDYEAALGLVPEREPARPSADKSADKSI